MPGPNAMPMTLEDLRGHLASDSSLPDATRGELRSRIKRFAEVAGKHPSEIIADPASIRTIAARANRHLAGLSKGSWANIVSGVTRAMDLADIKVHRRRRNFKLSLSWERLLELMNRRDRDELHRFAGWCSARQIGPEAVNIETFTNYLGYLQTETIQFNPKERWHVARRAWNRVVASRQDTSFPDIPDTTPQGWRGLKWSDFPESIQVELELYGRKMLTGDLLSDEEVRAIKPVTLNGYKDKLRWYLSRLVEDGVPIEAFGSLSACVETEMVKRGIYVHLAGRAIDDKTRPGLHGLMTAVLSVANYLNVPDEHRAALKKIAKKVRHSPVGMTEKNRERLSQFADIRAKRLFIGLPFKVAAELSTVTAPTVRQAQRMQHAALLALLLHLPIRIRNAAMLDLDKHIQRPVGTKPGRWRVHFEAVEVKNVVTIDGELDGETSALLDRYVSVFRPRLLKSASSALFINQHGGGKGPSALSKQFSGFVKREAGFIVNAHLMRHFAGFTFLDANPGQYETVRQLLGHKDIATTIRFYAGAETKNAFERYDHVLAMLMESKVGFVSEDEL